MMIVAQDYDLTSPQEFFLGRPASEYQFLGYDASLAIPGTIQYYAAVVSEN